jgi:hypothetical protein
MKSFPKLSTFNLALSLILTLTFTSHDGTQAFAFAPTKLVTSFTRHNNYGRGCISSYSTQIHAAKEDEIAALEEQLRKLKEGTPSPNESPETPDASSSSSSSADLDSDPDLDLIEEPLAALLSESWKDSEVTDDGGVVKNIIIAVVALLVALAVSQIPVGQEGYDRYSTAKPSTAIDLG